MLGMIALTATAMYEAAGSSIWCNPFPASEDKEILAGDPVLWSQVREVADAHLATYLSLLDGQVSHLSIKVFVGCVFGVSDLSGQALAITIRCAIQCLARPVQRITNKTQ
jgi:hypothetical protein